MLSANTLYGDRPTDAIVSLTPLWGQSALNFTASLTLHPDHGAYFGACRGSTATQDEVAGEEPAHGTPP